MSAGTGRTGQHSVTLWERWWTGVGDTPGEIVWAADADDLADDLDRFVGAFDPALPLIDLGCGDGRQTRFLAGHFRNVIGVDVGAAIGRARAGAKPLNADFEVLDVRDVAGADRLHRELGDANVYVRGVLQALSAEERPSAVETVAILLGAAGTLFAKELPPEAGTYFSELIERHGMPAGLAKVMQHIPPGELSLPELLGLFDTERFNVLDTGVSQMRTITAAPDGEVIAVPAVWALIQPTN